MPIRRWSEIVDNGVTQYKRTTTLTPTSESKIKYVRTRRFDDFNSTFELLSSMKDALMAHKEYYYKGVLHNDISLDTLMILESSDGSKRGALVELDTANSYRRPERPDCFPRSKPSAPPSAPPSAKGKEREA